MQSIRIEDIDDDHRLVLECFYIASYVFFTIACLVFIPGIGLLMLLPNVMFIVPLFIRILKCSSMSKIEMMESLLDRRKSIFDDLEAIDDMIDALDDDEDEEDGYLDEEEDD